MEFLLSFRLFQLPKKVKISKPIRDSGSQVKKTAFVNYVLLSVDAEFWKYLQVHGIFYRYLITTYTIAFFTSENSILVTDYINFILDVFFFIDLMSAIGYKTQYPKKQSKIKKSSPHLSKIVWRNAFFTPRKIWMICIDVISLLPLELVRFYVPFDSYIHNICHCTPALRIYRVPLYHMEAFKRMSSKIHPLVELFLKVGMFWLIISHSITCFWFWYFMPRQSELVYTLPNRIIFDQDNAFQWYLIIFYFVQVGFANIGFGDIVPTDDGERICTMLIISLGFIMLCGYLIAALSSAFAQSIRKLRILRLRISLMEIELDQKKVPEAISKKIIKFYYNLWVTRRGAGAENELLKTLPKSISIACYYDIFIPALNSSLLFRSFSEFTKRAVTQVMNVNLYMAGDTILKRNQINSSMFYIRKGTIQIMSYQDDETQIMTFGAGTVFGQFSLILSLPAKSEVHAATFCEIHLIRRRDLFLLLSSYPKAKEIVLNVHRNLLLNAISDKIGISLDGNPLKPENVVNKKAFYKVPLETTKIATDDICVKSTFPYVFVPDTVFLKMWNTCMAVFIVVICFYYPYCAAFTRQYPVSVEPFIILCDLLLIFNLYLHFSTGIVKENILFSSLNDIIASKSIKVSTYLDLASILPIHYFLNDSDRSKCVVLCLRCIEFYKIHYFFRKAEYTADALMMTIIRLIKYVLYFLFGGYAIGTIYYMQACYYFPCIIDSWYSQSATARSTDSPFAVSLYFAIVVMSGTGYGDVTVSNITDIGYVIVFALTGVLLFIYLIAEYSANLSLSREPRRNFKELADRVNAFLVSHKMLSGERIRVRQFLNLQWERNMGYEFIFNHDLYNDTPKHLLYEVNQFTRSRGLQDMELFKGIGDATIRSLLSCSLRKVLPPHEVVIYAGEVCSSLTIIEEGYCEMTYGKDISQKKILGSGQSICTVEFMLGMTAMCHVRTITHCVLMKVPKIHVHRSLMLNPIAAKELTDSIAEFKKTAIVQEFISFKPVRLHLTVRSSIQKSLYHFRYYRKQGGNKDLIDPFLKLGLCQWIRYILRSTTVLPYGKLLKCWELSRCIFAFFSALLFPCLPYFQLEFNFLYYFGMFLDITAWCDLYFRVHVCYYNNRKLLVSHPLWTCSHYIKGSFVLDFIFCFPFDRVMYRPIYDSQGLTYVTDPSINCLRLLRVGQIYRIPATINNLGIDFLSTPNLCLILLMMTAMTMVYIGFLTSICVLFCVNYKKDTQGNYQAYYGPQVEDHFMNILNQFHFSSQPSHIFIIIYYWMCVTAFGLGFGDITAGTKELMIFVIIVIVFSYLYFNYVTIIIASCLSSMNVNLTIYQQRMNHLIRFLKTENVEPLLRQHIINHFEYIWKKSKGMKGVGTTAISVVVGALDFFPHALSKNLSLILGTSTPAMVQETALMENARILHKAQQVFANFNSALRDDVMLFLYEETLKGVKAFNEMSPSFFRVLSSRVDEVNFQSGAGIYKHGDIIDFLAIIHQGEVTLVGESEDETETLKRSKIFGHFLEVPKGRAEWSAVATKNVTVLVIKTYHLYEVLAELHGEVKNETFESEKFKLQQLLIHSNSADSEVEEENARNLIFNKSTNWLVSATHKFSRPLMVMYVLLSVYSANIVTYDLAFQSYKNESLIYIVPIEVLFIVKIFLGFHTGYVNEAGDFVSDLPQIRRKYMTLTKFYFDFFSVIPFEFLSAFAPPGDRLYTMSWLRMTKVIRLYNIWYFFNLKYDTLNVNMVMLKLVDVAAWTATLLHQWSCAWYLVSCPRADCPESLVWQELNEFDRSNAYLKCLYFVLCVLTTTGFGDITPRSLVEIIFVIFLSFVAFFYTAIFIGQMVSTAQKSVYSKKQYEFELEEMKTYLHANDVSYDTQKAVLNYIENLWRNEKGQQVPELLLDAPSYLTNEIKLSTYGYHINENVVFKQCNVYFRKHLIYALRRTVFFPGDPIVHEGLVNRTAYFVHAGLVEGKDFAGKLRITNYEEGGFFGLRQGLTKAPHSRTYFAKTLCIILSLEYKHWKFLKHFFREDINLITKEVDSHHN